MKSNPKPLKKVKRGALVKKAHALIRDIVLFRDKGCVCPPPQRGHTAIRQAGHVIRSVKGGTQFSLLNVHEQCSGCNQRHVRDWQIYQNWFLHKFGHMTWVLMCEESQSLGLKSYEITDLIEQLKLIKERQAREPNWKPYFSQSEILSGAWSAK